ncbi:MAG: hypothetical protein CSB44_12005 [Gammaproteobacteria bacterium]|nr:MAG: hypothetical protein CSB44_12005 [Gammaproteobacteria bacterium]
MDKESKIMIKTVLATSLLLAGLSIACLRPALADDAIAPEMRTEVLKLLDALNAPENMLQQSKTMLSPMVKSLTADNPDITTEQSRAIKEEILAVFADNFDDMMEQLVVVYARHFTLEDIQGLNEFYATPLGQKFIKKNMALYTESSKAGTQWVQQLMPEIKQRVEKRMETECISLEK